MKAVKIAILGAVASTVLCSGLHAQQGLLGRSYFEVGGGFERLKTNGPTLDGWTGGAEINVPAPGRQGQMSVDLNLQADYSRVTEGDDRATIIESAGILRGYTGFGRGIKPYFGAGLGWVRTDFTFTGVSRRDDTFTVPVEAGVELQGGAFSLTPFGRYTWALGSGLDDFWTLGAKAAYRVTREWSIVAEAALTDWDNGRETQSLTAGLLFTF